MFCSECGAKNAKNSTFCSECGSKIIEKKEDKKSSKKIEKDLDSKNSKKVLFVIIVLVIMALGVGYKVCSDLTSPKHIASEYVKAVVSNDTDKIYNYLELKGDKTFITKKVFKTLVKKTNTSNIENYKVTDVFKKSLTATVKFAYTTKGSSYESTDTIDLIKAKNKRYFIFDNWKIADVDTSKMIMENYTIKTLKGTELKYAGIKVNKKYLDKSKSDSEYDVYVLPQVFKYETVLTAKLPNGMEIENKVTPSVYYDTITVKFDKNSISKDMEKTLCDTSKSVLTTVYEKAIGNKPVEEVLKEFKHNDIDLSKIELDYKDLVSNLESAINKLIEIKFKDLSIYSLDVKDDGDFEVEFKVNYDYIVEYTTLDSEIKTITKSSYSYITLTYEYENSKFYLKDLENLKTYFSRY